MATQGLGQHFRAFHAQIDPAVLDAGNGGLRNTAQGRELGLAQPLQFPDDPHRLAGRDLDAFPGWLGLAHVNGSDSHAG